jgi:hypothetical protein
MSWPGATREIPAGLCFAFRAYPCLTAFVTGDPDFSRTQDTGARVAQTDRSPDEMPRVPAASRTMFVKLTLRLPRSIEDDT